MVSDDTNLREADEGETQGDCVQAKDSSTRDHNTEDNLGGEGRERERREREGREREREKGGGRGREERKGGERDEGRGEREGEGAKQVKVLGFRLEDLSLTPENQIVQEENYLASGLHVHTYAGTRNLQPQNKK